MGIVGVIGTSIENGTHIGRGLCQLEGFIYIISGKFNQIDRSASLYKIQPRFLKSLTICMHSFIGIEIDEVIQ